MSEIQVTISPASSESPASPVSEYELKIDSQVEKFLETKHRLVYFLVTASVAPIVVVVQFVYGKVLAGWISGLASLGVMTGLVSAGSALSALWFEVASYRNHIQFRYQRKTWDVLTTSQQSAWTKINQWALRFTKFAFVLLALEFALFAAVGIGIIASPPQPGHRAISIQIPLR